MSMRNPGDAVPVSLATPRSLSEEPTQAALDHDASPLDLALDHQNVQRYEEALLRLPPATGGRCGAASRSGSRTGVSPRPSA